MSKPTSKPEWIPSDDPTKIIAPSGSKQATGWLPSEKPPVQFFNWFWNLVSKWIAYLEEVTDAAILGDAQTTNLRALEAIITGIGSSKIQVAVYSRYNSDNILTETNLEKGGSTTSFSLNAAGDVLKIKDSALTGSCDAILNSDVKYNASGVDLYASVLPSSGDMAITVTDVSGGGFDLTTLGVGDGVRVLAVYLT